MATVINKSGNGTKDQANKSKYTILLENQALLDDIKTNTGT